MYIILPEKYVMYNIKHTDKNYHQFIPRMHAQFDKLGIKYIDLYSDFAKSDQLLYYKTDTHWNKNGVDIAIANTLLYFNGDSSSITNSTQPEKTLTKLQN